MWLALVQICIEHARRWVYRRIVPKQRLRPPCFICESSSASACSSNCKDLYRSVFSIVFFYCCIDEALPSPLRDWRVASALEATMCWFGSSAQRMYSGSLLQKYREFEQGSRGVRVGAVVIRVLLSRAWRKKSCKPFLSMYSIPPGDTCSTETFWSMNPRA